MTPCPKCHDPSCLVVQRRREYERDPFTLAAYQNAEILCRIRAALRERR